MDSTINTVSDVSARVGVAFPAPAQRPAPAGPVRTPTPAVPRVAAAGTAQRTGAERTPPLPVTAQRAALERPPGRASAEADEAQTAYALTITDALWQLTKSFRQVV